MVNGAAAMSSGNQGRFARTVLPRSHKNHRRRDKEATVRVKLELLGMAAIGWYAAQRLLQSRGGVTFPGESLSREMLIDAAIAYAKAMGAP
jgi:hypothetical protein